MYLAPRDAQHLQMQPASAPASVHTASNQVVRSTHTAFLDWPTMPASTRQGHVFSEFGSSLISVPMLADAQLTTTFTSRGVFVTRDLGDPQHTDVIMQGGRNARGLFELPLSYTIPSAMASPPPAVAAVASVEDDVNGHFDVLRDVLEGTTYAAIGSAYSSLRIERSAAQLMRFYGKTLGNQPDSTIQAALDDGLLDMFPGLTSKRWRAHPPNSIDTAKGHLDRLRKNVGSTAPPPYNPHVIPLPTGTSAEDNPPVDSDLHPEEVRRTPPSSCTPIFTARYSVAALHCDNTGNIKIKSTYGNQSVLVMYSECGNYIHMEPMPSATATAFVAAYTRGFQWFRSRGIYPEFVRLDNQTSVELDAFFRLNHTGTDLVPPNNHRTLKAERMIRTAKNHLIATWSGMDPDFPSASWDDTIEAAELTLALTRKSGVPGVSAHQYLNGKYDYSSHPIAPIGTKVLTYNDCDDRASWAQHGVTAFYVGTSFRHYRAFRVVVESTHRMRVSDTVS